MMVKYKEYVLWLFGHLINLYETFYINNDNNKNKIYTIYKELVEKYEDIYVHSHIKYKIFYKFPVLYYPIFFLDLLRIRIGAIKK